MSWEIIRVKESSCEPLVLVHTKAGDYPEPEEIVDLFPYYSSSDVAELLDRDAENMNAHDFVGLHEKLLGVLLSLFEEEEVHEVMNTLLESRGLHGLNDVGGCGTRYE